MSIAVTAGFAEVNGTRLYYEVAGRGHPLVFNHAGIADCRMWDDQIEVFARSYSVIRWDARGCGRTALDFTLEYPDMVGGLIPVASALSGYTPPPNPIMPELREAVAQGDTARAVELQLRRWVDGPNRDPGQVSGGVRERVRQMCAGALGLWEGVEQPLAPPALGRLDEIRAPTLIVEGDQDVPYISDIARLLAAGIRRAKSVVISGVAHMVNMEKPEEFNRIALDFLKSVER